LNEPAGGGRWLARNLLLWLMLPLLAIVLATAAFGIYTAHRLADRVFDGWLLDAAGSVAALVRFEHAQALLDLPPAAEKVLLYDVSDHTYFSVMQDQRLLAGRAGIPGAGESAVRYDQGSAFEAQLDGQPVRVARIDLDAGSGNYATVLVAETLGKRARARQDLIAVLWPMGALVVAAASAIMLAIRFTVRPLQAIAARWNERSHASLQAISVDGVPRELMPFATALNDLLERIRAILARERQFATTAAHQLRTPLAGLQLGLARAAEAPDLPTARLVIGELSQSTQRTARLVQQLLALGRLDPEGRGDAGFCVTDLVAMARDVGSAYVEQALAKKINFELVAATPTVPANVHPDLVAEALSNLLDNAIRYTPEGGRVVLEVSSDPVRLCVCDSGPGIAEDEREAVLERFVRGRLAVGDGSGLGLSIVRDICTLHGASVTLSDSDWGGACVTIAFPKEA